MANQPNDGSKTAAQRRTMVRSLNQAFGRGAIEATVARLTPLGARADFLDISDALGVLEPFTRGDLRGYRRSLSIPMHMQRFVTLAFRTAVTERIPLKLDIVTGPRESARLDISERQISLTLIRAELPSAGRTRRSPTPRRKSG